ncbi:MAG: OmpA family protein [Elusimicrobiota bacterium]
MLPFMHRMSPSTMEENPLWMIVLSDMMTNLMLFFLVMYVLTQGGRQMQEEMVRGFDGKGIVATAKEREAEAVVAEFKEEQAARDLKELLSSPELKGSVEVQETEEYIRVRLLDKILFGTASAELAASAQRAVSLLAAVLRQIDNEVIVEGHTDVIPVVSGPYRSNWELSVARSHSLIERLSADGVAPERLVAAGYGEYHPIADNATAEGRSANRRVEVLILRQKEAEQ